MLKQIPIGVFAKYWTAFKITTLLRSRASNAPSSKSENSFG